MPFLIDAHHIGARQTGNETWIRNISRELVTLAPTAEFVFVSSRAGAEDVTRLTGTTPIAVSDSSTRRLLVDLPGAARRVHADAVLVQYTMPVRASAPSVVMIHDLSAFAPMSKHWLPASFRVRVQMSIRSSVRRAAQLLAPSQFTRQQLIELLGADPARVHVSNNAVDPDLAALLEQRNGTKSLRQDVFQITAVGNVLPRKNLVTLARAVAELRRTGIPAELRIVGTVVKPELTDELRTLLGPAVSTTGYVDTATLAAEYAAADVLGFPSLFEGFGIPALEAMCAGVPVIVSNSTSLPEVVGDAGLTVPPLDVGAWAQALRAVHGDSSLRARLCESGRRRATKFTWRAGAKAALDSLRTAATRRSAS